MRAAISITIPVAMPLSPERVVLSDSLLRHFFDDGKIIASWIYPFLEIPIHREFPADFNLRRQGSKPPVVRGYVLPRKIARRKIVIGADTFVVARGKIARRKVLRIGRSAGNAES